MMDDESMEWCKLVVGCVLCGVLEEELYKVYLRVGFPTYTGVQDSGRGAREGMYYSGLAYAYFIY
jgi:hypothetical protein